MLHQGLVRTGTFIAHHERNPVRPEIHVANRGALARRNPHVDVVPPSEGMDDPYSGRIEDGILYGRGACDTKGPLSSLYCLLTLLEEQQTDPDCDLIFHLVVEEENGGNGSLAMVRHGEKADGCIVMEPTEGRILTSIRGAVWFKIDGVGAAYVDLVGAYTADVPAGT